MWAALLRILGSRKQSADGEGVHDGLWTIEAPGLPNAGGFVNRLFLDGSPAFCPESAALLALSARSRLAGGIHPASGGYLA